MYALWNDNDLLLRISNDQSISTRYSSSSSSYFYERECRDDERLKSNSYFTLPLFFFCRFNVYLCVNNELLALLLLSFSFEFLFHIFFLIKGKNHKKVFLLLEYVNLFPFAFFYFFILNICIFASLLLL